MSSFNEITVKSNLNLNVLDYAGLCFRDDLLISSRRYSLIKDTITLLDNPGDLLSLYYNNGIGQIYEFSVRLYQPGIQLNTVDSNNKLVENLVASNLLVFVDGILQTPDDYFVLDTNILTFTHEYTNDPNKKFTVIVYSINKADYFVRRTIPLTYEVQGDLSSLNLNSIQLDYNINNTIIFANGKKIPYTSIEYTDKALSDDISLVSSYIKINIDAETAKSIERLEYIQFDTKKTNTKSLNFSTIHGYLTYGPFDDYGNEVTEKYDTIVTLNNQAKVLIDNIRTGFIIKEREYDGELLIVDTNFETQQLKCLTITPFRKLEYLEDEYYLEVPESTKITKYLAEFDKKYSFLPEILDIFQRLLLDEINDSIERLRNIRNIHKVDSVNINKLLSLLGFNVNIKTLTKKQRMELLEELSEYYRRVGTRSSYNVLNILQNDLKLINMEQLFTPHYPHSKESTLYSYNINNIIGGTGYQLGQYLEINDSNSVKLRVSDVDPITGEILDLEPEALLEGYKEKNGTYSLVPAGSFSLSVNSTRPLYHYDWTITGSENYTAGLRLKTIKESPNDPVNYSLTINSVTTPNGQIASYTPDQPLTGENVLSLNQRTLYKDVPVPMIKVTPHYHPELATEADLVFSSTEGGRAFSTNLEPGVYKVVMSGAGGSGSAADSYRGATSDWDSQNGYNGELRTDIILNLSERSTLRGIVGQGGGRVLARASSTQLVDRNYGKGYSEGTLGVAQYRENVFYKYGSTPSEYRTYRNGTYLGEKQMITCAYGRLYTGQGGGSTGFEILQTGETYQARGGNGGDVNLPLVTYNNLHNHYNPGGYGSYGTYTITMDSQTITDTLIAGGKGGGGGTTTGTGAAGGYRAWHRGDFTSGRGADGYIKIYKLHLTYDWEIVENENLLNTAITYETLESFNQQFTLAYINGAWEISPADGRDNNETTIDLNNNIFELRPTNENRSAKLSILSTESAYYYEVSARSLNPEYLRPGFVLKNAPTDPVQFEFTITNVIDGDNISGTWTPQTGSQQLQIYSTPAYLQVGTGAQIEISSLINTQRNEDREYIDFYKKQQVGAIEKKEYRIATLNYGTITTGTPHSPEWWTVGEPDIDYGSITVLDTAAIDYGEITDEIKGEWVEWWEWDRKNIWYPTNHVELEMKLPVGVNFEDYTQRFIEQFYALASTVIYIHTIVQSFYFGKDITTGADPEELTGASFGIITAPPYVEEFVCLTSDPSIQILPQDYKLTILPSPNDAEITFVIDGETYYDNPVSVPENTQVEYTVSRTGYTTVTNTVTVTSNMTIAVTLVPTEYTFTIIPTPANANVRITGNNQTVEGEGTQSVTIPYGTVIQYLVQRGNMEAWDLGPVNSEGIPITNEDEGQVRAIATLTKDMGMIPLEGTGYIPQSGIVTIEDDTTLEIELEPLPNE